MKKLIILVFILLISTGAYADTWCQWSGTEGTQCLNDRDGVVRIIGKVPTRTESIINSYGYYRVVVTEPTVGADQTKDAVVWGFTGTQITKTWTVRDLTSGEIDSRDAQPMPLSEYYLWKTLIVTGVITQQQAQNNLPQELIDAYLARDRIENP